MMTQTHTPTSHPAPLAAPVKVAVAARAEALGQAMPSGQVLRILAVVLAVIVLWAAAIATFGYPALIVPALIAVPTIFVILIAITRG